MRNVTTLRRKREEIRRAIIASPASIISELYPLLGGFDEPGGIISHCGGKPRVSTGRNFDPILALSYIPSHGLALTM